MLLPIQIQSRYLALRAPICEYFKGENLSVSLTHVHTSHVESQKEIKGKAIFPRIIDLVKCFFVGLLRPFSFHNPCGID